MNIYTAIGAYVVIWWTVIFAILPWGVQRDDTPVPGQDSGAPTHVRFGLKLMVTTVVSAIFFGLFYLLSGYFSFR